MVKICPGGEGTGDLWGAWRIYEKCPKDLATEFP
jgi:hypothetical protein